MQFGGAASLLPGVLADHERLEFALESGKPEQVIRVEVVGTHLQRVRALFAHADDRVGARFAGWCAHRESGLLQGVARLETGLQLLADCDGFVASPDEVTFRELRKRMFAFNGEIEERLAGPEADPISCAAESIRAYLRAATDAYRKRIEPHEIILPVATSVAVASSAALCATPDILRETRVQWSEGLRLLGRDVDLEDSLLPPLGRGALGRGDWLLLSGLLGDPGGVRFAGTFSQRTWHALRDLEVFDCRRFLEGLQQSRNIWGSDTRRWGAEFALLNAASPLRSSLLSEAERLDRNHADTEGSDAEEVGVQYRESVLAAAMLATAELSFGRIDAAREQISYVAGYSVAAAQNHIQASEEVFLALWEAAGGARS